MFSKIILIVTFSFYITARVEKIFVENKCESCTATQTKLVYAWVNKFIDQYPDMFRAALAKYAENLGVMWNQQFIDNSSFGACMSENLTKTIFMKVNLPPDTKRRMMEVLGDDP